MIHEILEESGLNFEEEYIFPELKSNNGRPLRFDFAVFDDDGNLDFLIEYQGSQHYQASSKFGGKKDYINNNLMIIKRDVFVRLMILNQQKFHTLKRTQ